MGVTGIGQLDALASELRAAGSKAAVEMQTAVINAGRRVEDEARRRVPVRTGDLWRSIGFGQVSMDAGSAYVEVKAGDNQVDYEGYVEYGTSRMAPQPYMIPALDVVEPSLEADVERVASRALP